MKFGIVFANTGPFVHPEAAAEFAVAAEDVGIESLWTVEHVVVPQGYVSTYPYDPSGKMPGPEDSDIPDPLIWLSYLAAVTKRINLATGILILPQRNPVVLAKEVATLDHLSGGRMHLGVGVGWLEEEFDAIGVPFAERGAITDDYMAAMRALWSQDAATYDGTHISFENCISRPSPQGGTVPIHVGGHSKPAARRAGRIGDGFFPGKGSKEVLTDLIGVMRQSAADAGRDPSQVEVTSGGNGAVGPNARDEVAALEAIGVDRVVIPSFLFWDKPKESLEKYALDVMK